MGRITLLAIVLLLAVVGCRQDGQSPVRREMPAAAVVSPTIGSPSDPGRRSAEIAPLAVPTLPGRAENNGPWPLPLDQAIAIALQHCDVVRVLDGGEVVSGAATSYDAAIVDQSTKVALAAFDTSFGASLFWNRINQPPDAFFEPGVLNPGRYDEGGFTLGLNKAWLTGTQTRISYNPPTGYLFFPNGAEGFNPTQTANVELSIRQPILRGGGVEFNSAPIVIDQIKTNQSAWDFKQAMMDFVRSVEQAYWELNAAQIALSGVEEQLPLIEEVVRIEQASLEAKRAIPADVAKARAQLHAFRQRRLRMQSLIAEKEIQIRHLLGVDPSQGGRIIPVTAPSRAPFVIDPQVTLATAMNHRPDLLRQRLGLRIREMELVIARNSLLPQLDAQALYRMNGVGGQLGDALAMMGENRYVDWQLGATFSVPLGRNAGKANVRAAELQMEREHALLRQKVQGVAYQLANIIQRIELLHQQCEEADAQVRQCQEWLRGARVRYQIPMPGGEGGNWLLQALDDYLLAMRSTADATAEMGDLLARYNTEVAILQEASGVLLENGGICLSEDPTRRIRISSCASQLPVVNVPVPPGPAGPERGNGPQVPTMPGPPQPPGVPMPNPPVEMLPLPANPAPTMGNPPAAPRQEWPSGPPPAPMTPGLPVRGMPVQASAMQQSPRQQPAFEGYPTARPPLDSLQGPAWFGPAPLDRGTPVWQPAAQDFSSPFRL